MRSDVSRTIGFWRSGSARLRPSGLRRARFALRLAWLRHAKPEAWWSQTGSNRRPHACKARALPAELWPHFLKRPACHDCQPRLRQPVFAQVGYAGHASPFVLRGCATRSPKGEAWWAWEDLNFRPHAYQARALTN